MIKKIPLVRDTIDNKDINYLIEWLQTNPRLTKGDITIEFEKKWSEWLGVKYSIFVNSGSSANLAMIYSLLLSGKLKNKKTPEKSGVFYFPETRYFAPFLALGLCLR